MVCLAALCQLGLRLLNVVSLRVERGFWNSLTCACESLAQTMGHWMTLVLCMCEGGICWGSQSVAKELQLDFVGMKQQ